MASSLPKELSDGWEILLNLTADRNRYKKKQIFKLEPIKREFFRYKLHSIQA